MMGGKMKSKVENEDAPLIASEGKAKFKIGSQTGHFVVKSTYTPQSSLIILLSLFSNL
jgi:hypothetical protein